MSIQRVANRYNCNAFDNSNYGICSKDALDDVYHFPVAVAVIEKVDLPSQVYEQDENGTGTVKSKDDSSWSSTAVIKLLETKAGLPSDYSDNISEYIFSQVCQECKYLSHLYAATKLDEHFFVHRDEESDMKELTVDMRRYYAQNDSPSWMTKDILNQLAHHYSQPSQEARQGDQQSQKEGTGQRYSNSSPLTKLYEKFNFTHLCPHNETYTVDEDDSLQLGYEGCVYTCERSLFKNIIPEYSSTAKVVCVTNKPMYTLRYLQDSVSQLGQDGAPFTLEDAGNEGHFRSFNYLWRWTFTPYQALRQSGLSKIFR